MVPHDNSSPPPSGRDSTREYILDMIGQLATMAKKLNEVEIATHLTAVREAAARATRRKGLH